MVDATALFQEVWTEMNQDLRNTLEKLDADNIIDRDAGEFTAREAVGIWASSKSGTRKKLRRLKAEGKVTSRDAYDPEVKLKVKAYKIKEDE